MNAPMSNSNALTVTAKGQITLKKELLQHLGVTPGQKVEIHKTPGGSITVRAAQRTGKISDAFGMLWKEGRKPLSIDEINEITAQGWAGER